MECWSYKKENKKFSFLFIFVLKLLILAPLGIVLQITSLILRLLKIENGLLNRLLKEILNSLGLNDVYRAKIIGKLFRKSSPLAGTLYRNFELLSFTLMFSVLVSFILLFKILI